MLRLMSCAPCMTNGKNEARRYECVLLSASTPASLTVTGADVDGMDDNAVIAKGSTIITPDENYLAFEDGVFTKKE